jgi:SAM-dependent methyltransferase
MDIKESDILGDDIGNHWYYASKAKAMRAMLGDQPLQRVLDVGAGSGFFSKHLLSHTDAQEAWCVDISYEAESDALLSGKSIHYRQAIGSIDADLALFMDVLEHVDDDVALLKHYVDKVPHGSRFLISVPAFEFLWSSHDVFLDHRRRYVLGQLEKVVRSAGLVLLTQSYYFGAVFPLAAMLRLSERLRGGSQPARSQLNRHSKFVNGMLSAVCAAEVPLLRFNRLAGLSVMSLARKP